MTLTKFPVFALVAITLAWSTTRADANSYGYVETVYTSPSVLTVPTAYVIPSSYTTYVTPSVYVPTSTLIPTYYRTSATSYVYPTYYYRPSLLFPRRYLRRELVATTAVYDYSVVPTTYVVPTVSYPVVSTASTLCDSAPSVIAMAPRSSGSGTSGGDASGTAEPGLDRNTIRSSPRNNAGAGGANAGGGNAGVANPADADVPNSPAPDAGEAPNLIQPKGDGERHQAQRPAFGNAPRAVGLARSVLRGRIVSALDGKPEKGVNVVVMDARGRFRDKTATTGADGRFALMLPEGDWTVRVPKADGQNFADREITVAGGLITDDRDQEVSNLTINR
jgi:hypothetical protein